MQRCYSGALLKLNINEHFREGMAEAFTSYFSTCQKSGLKPGPIWPAPFNGWEEITNICIFKFRKAIKGLVQNLVQNHARPTSRKILSPGDGVAAGENLERPWGEHSPASFPLYFHWGEVDTSSILYIYSSSAASPQPPPATSSPATARGKPFIVGGRGGPL